MTDCGWGGSIPGGWGGGVVGGGGKQGGVGRRYSPGAIGGGGAKGSSEQSFNFSICLFYVV